MEGEEDAFDTGPPPSDEECEVPVSYDQAPAGAEAAEEQAVAEAEAVPEKSLAEVRSDFESLFGRYWRGRGCAQPPVVHVTWWRNDPSIYWHLWFAVQVRAVRLCRACATQLTLFTAPTNHPPSVTADMTLSPRKSCGARARTRCSARRLVRPRTLCACRVPSRMPSSLRRMHHHLIPDQAGVRNVRAAAPRVRSRSGALSICPLC